MASTNTALIVPPAATNAGLAGTEELRDIRPPVRIADPWAWAWWGLLLLALAAILAWWWWRRRHRPPAPPTPPIPPHVRAKQRLNEALLHIGDARLFCFLVSDALRTYLEERFHLRAPERTTEEFLNDLQSTPHLTSTQKLSLGDFLERCDLVKFARFEPTETALRDLHESALRLVDETRFEAAPAPPAGSVPAPASRPAAEASVAGASQDVAHGSDAPLPPP
jgi:hypothetical protein